MIAKLLFDLENPDDKREYEQANRAADYKLALYAVATAVRNNQKYGNEPKTMEEMAKVFWNIMQEYKIDPYEG